MKINRYDERAVADLRAMYGRYGYAQFKMSKFEEYDLYVRNKSFLISDNIITFTDRSGKLMALKPDVTLSIVKNTRDDGSVKKVHYAENVYRVSKGSDLYKEIMQIGLECMGEIGTYEIYEVLSLAAKSLGRIADDFVLDVSHMGLVSAIMDELSVPETIRAELLSAVGEKNPHGIKAICEREGMSAKAIETLCALATTYGEPKKVIEWLSRVVGEKGKALLSQLFEILELLENELTGGRINIDFSVINDMNYYNGIVFKGFIKGVPSGILSGGQYDHLMEKMGKRSGAIGFAIYPDMLEEMNSSPSEYDVDVVLLAKGASLAEINSEVKKLIAGGESVTVQRSLPEKLRYRRVAEL